MNPAVFSAPANPMVRLDELKRELEQKGRTVFDFGVGDPREPMPPFLIAALCEAVPPVGQYPRALGSPALRRAIADYLARRFSVSLDPERHVLPSSGAKEAIFHLAPCLIDPDGPRRAVVYPDPGYPIYERGSAFARGEAYPVLLREDRGYLLEPDQIPSEVLDRTAIFWINYPQNPTGAVAKRAYLERVAEASRCHGFVVASDECYADVYFDEPPPSYLEVTTERALAFHSLSKRSGMTGMRSGFIAGDPTLIEALKTFRPAIGTASQDFVQAAATVAWDDDAHANHRRECFARKRELFLVFLRETDLAVHGSRAGMYLWLKVPNGLSSSEYAVRLAHEVGILLTPGSFLGPGGEGFVRLALSPTLERCQQAIAHWKATL
jgi:acetylornithine/N-succinyldiaminopimelate aminotransferase